MKRLAFVTVLMAALCVCATPSHAGVWGNFWAAVGKAVEDYNTDMLATGDAVNAALKDGKIMDAFTAYEKNIQVVGDHALANSKAVYAALKEIVLWLPKQLKKIWDKFVEILQKIRDSLAALNQPGGGIIPAGKASMTTTKGSSTYDDGAATKRGWMDAFDFKPLPTDNGSTPVTPAPSSDDDDAAVVTPPQSGSFKGLGDGWVEAFEQGDSLTDKLKTYSQYRGHCHTMGLWMQSLDKKNFEAIDPQFTKVTSECDLIESVLFEEIATSLDGDGAKMREYDAFVKSLGKDEADVMLGSLTQKLSRRAKMLGANGSN